MIDPAKRLKPPRASRECRLGGHKPRNQRHVDDHRIFRFAEASIRRGIAMSLFRSSIAALAGCICAIASLPSPWASAQLSPKCERNGKRDYCAITPVAGATNIRQTFDMIMFADDTVYEVVRYNESCKMISDKLETCSARIITPPGNPKPISAIYRRSFYEGGVKQEYVGKGIHITYYFVD